MLEWHEAQLPSLGRKFMTTIQLQSSVTPDQLLQGIGQLEHEEFEKIFSQLTILRAQRRYFTETKATRK